MPRPSILQKLPLGRKHTALQTQMQCSLEGKGEAPDMGRGMVEHLQRAHPDEALFRDLESIRTKLIPGPTAPNSLPSLNAALQAARSRGLSTLSAELLFERQAPDLF